MYLSEILDVTLDYTVNLNDVNSMSKMFDIDGEKLPGNECVSRFVTDTLEQSYTDYETPGNDKGESLHKLEVEDVLASNTETPLDVGPNRYLTISIRTKIRHGLALKYNIITKDCNLSHKDTWASYLKPNIFYSLVNDEKVYSKLTSIDIADFIGQKLKKNNDKTLSRYEYKFYDTEKADWANPERLKDISFNDGYLEIKIDMPVYEEKVPPKEEIEDNIERRSF